jgi:hypothetical protein
LPKAREGIAIAQRDFNGPALPIVLEDILRAQREVGGEEGLDGRARLARAGRSGPRGRGAPDQHHADYAPGEHRVPQALPGLDQGPRFRGMGLPAVALAGQGFGRAE